MRNINLFLGLMASIALAGLPNTVLANEMVEFCNSVTQQNIIFSKKQFTQSSLAYLRTPKTIEDNQTVDIIVVGEKNNSLWEEALQIQNAKNSKITLQKQEEIYQNGLRNFNVDLKPYQKPPAPYTQNFMKGTDIVFNNHLIL